MDRARLTYQPGLDGLRALAVGAVIAFHLGYPWAQGGFLGVDAFFVLSGFLITSLLLAERRATRRVSLRGFWSRRARRLLPALFLMLAIVSLYSANNVPSFQLGALRGDALSSIFYVANWHFINTGQSYFALFINPLPFDHLWSLAIEEQFYVLWPLILLGLVRLGRGSNRALAIGTVVGIVGSQVAMSVLYSPANPSRAYYGTDARSHTILIGCLLALILDAAPDLPKRAGALLQGFGLLSVSLGAAALVMGRAGPIYFNGGSLVFAVGVAVVIAAVIAPTGLLRRVLSLAPMRYVGRISYGLYLWHWPVIVFMTESTTGLPSEQLNPLRMLVTFALTIASFHLVEQPILHDRARRLPRPQVLVSIGLTIVLVSVFVGTLGAKSPRRVLGRLTGTVGLCGKAPSFETAAARAELRDLGPISGTPPPAPLRIAVFGDSRACSLLTGLEVTGRSLGASVGNGAILGCGLVAGAIAENPMVPRTWARSCLDRVHRRIDTVLRESDPQLVLWYSGWEINDLEVDDHIARFGSREYRDLILDRLEETYQRARAPGRRIVLLTQPAETSSDVLSDPEPENQERFVVLNSLYRQFADRHPEDVAVVDLAGRICPNGHPCRPTRGGIRPRPFDGIHFSPQGATWAADWIWPQLFAVWPEPVPASS